MKTGIVILLAVIGAALYAVSNVLEHHEARRAPPEVNLRAGLILYLVRRRIWLIGMACDVIGFFFHAAAFGLGSLVIVAPVLATGLIFSLGLGAVMDRRPLSRREWIAAFALVAGLAAFLVVGNPHGGRATAGARSWIVTLLVMVPLIVTALLTTRVTSGSIRAMFLGITSGLIYGLTAPVTKSVVHQLGDGPLTILVHGEAYALAVLSIAGLIITQSAFQSGRLAAALPGIEATEPVVTVVLGLALLGERLTATTIATKAVIPLAAAVMFVSVVVLARWAGEDEERSGRSDHTGRVTDLA